MTKRVKQKRAIETKQEADRQRTYYSVGHLFGVARNTVSVIVHETCIPIVETLFPIYIQFPSGNGLREVIDGFKQMLGVPQCAGSIDWLHVPVTPPAMNHTDYYNRKG